MTSPWQKYTLNEGDRRYHHLGGGSFVILRTSREWQVARVPGGTPLPQTDQFDDLSKLEDWQRWDAGKSGYSYELSPLMPSLPLIAHPRAAVTIPARGRATFYLSVPIRISIKAGQGEHAIELPPLVSKRLRNTWHGDTSSGEHCLLLPTEARRELAALDETRDEAICSVELQNKQAVPFIFDNLLFDATLIGLYEVGEQLWGNACRISPEADLQNASMKVLPGPPEPIKNQSPRMVLKVPGSRHPRFQQLFGGIKA